jgi:hypothetical protein
MYVMSIRLLCLTNGVTYYSKSRCVIVHPPVIVLAGLSREEVQVVALFQVGHRQQHHHHHLGVAGEEVTVNCVLDNLLT